ncbi:hypothetical protein F0L74_00955 [Chitinophaga agrisoli]|uniref:Uncharacterized protein n=1 Tax=Chitinophaga agrisoli TaxID=2607653 RepID=A0A5B2W265_9BACT|nr:hypothetical protein [Chitinophaga agrisoli]KAA2244577.1 hypothetical protein F0L74_00955 [Chitinophaga agrisoli]
MSGLIQEGSGELQCRLAFQVTGADGSTFLDTATALDHYEAELQLHRALQGWANDMIAPLNRIKITTEDRGDAFRVRMLTTQDRHDAFRVRVLSYSLNFQEYPVTTPTSVIAAPLPEVLPY